MRRLDPVLAAELALDCHEALDLAGIAQDLLVEGFDSPSLRLLAGTPREDLRHEGHDLLERSLRELGIRLPEHDDAVLTLVRATARKIVDGEITPHDGASEIIGLRQTYHELLDDDERLDFAYQIYAWEDPPPKYQRRMDAIILDGARTFLKSTA